MNRDDDTRIDDTLREFLRHRAADTSAVRDSSAMSAAIALRVPERARAGDGVLARQLLLVVVLAALLLLAAAALFVTGQRPRVPPVSVTNGAISYAIESGISPVFLVRPGEEPRQVIPGDSSVGNPVVCPTFSPDGTMLAVGMPSGSIVVLSIDAAGEVVNGGPGRLRTRANESPHCPAWAPDGSAVAFLDQPFGLAESAHGGATLEIDPLAGEPRRIAGWEPEGAADAAFSTDYPADRAVDWSPDGTAIAVARPTGTWLLPVDSAAPRRLHDSPANTVSWSPDGTRLVVRTLRGTLVISAGDAVVLATLPAGTQPAWSPTDDRIAYVDDRARVITVDPDGSDPQLVSDYGYNVTWSPDGTRILYVRDVDSRAYTVVSQAIDADGRPVGEPETVVPVVPISDARSFPDAQSFSWQPLLRSAP